MLSDNGCRARRMRTWNAIPKSIDWMLVANPFHINYLSGFWVNPVSQSRGHRAFLVLERGGKTTLVCDNFTLNAAIAAPHVDATATGTWYDHRHSVPDREEILFSALDSTVGGLKKAEGLVDGQWVPLAVVDALAEHHIHVEADGTTPDALFRRFRRSKDPDEIEILKRCMAAGEAGHRRGKEVTRPGISEMDVYREVASASIEALGVPGVVYGDFRATTPSEPLAGGPATGYVLEDGNTLILDFSVELAGYRSDFTNTLAVGTPTAEQQRLVELCKEGLKAGEAELRLGAAAADVYRAVNEPFVKAGYPLSAHAGHGLGMGHPEAPAFVPESDEVLVDREVVTLEPAAYVEGIGGVRLEHNYLVSDVGLERLSNHVLGL